MTGFKAALLVLLAANCAYFALFETASKALDAAAWLVLLALFAAEAMFGERLRAGRGRFAVRAARLVAGAGVIVAALAYILEENALDAATSALWILVVIVLEAQLRWPQAAAQHRRAFNAAACTLFGGLAVLVALWAAQGLWFDAYDAALWLVAYATIEIDISRHARA